MVDLVNDVSSKRSIIFYRRPRWGRLQTTRDTHTKPHQPCRATVTCHMQFTWQVPWSRIIVEYCSILIISIGYWARKVTIIISWRIIDDGKWSLHRYLEKGKFRRTSKFMLVRHLNVSSYIRLLMRHYQTSCTWNLSKRSGASHVTFAQTFSFQPLMDASQYDRLNQKVSIIDTALIIC